MQILHMVSGSDNEISWLKFFTEESLKSSRKSTRLLILCNKSMWQLRVIKYQTKMLDKKLVSIMAIKMLSHQQTIKRISKS